MNIEFHYYILYILCKEAGLDEQDCITIAYSSQYVDNNLVAHTIKGDGIARQTIVTQNYGWWSDWFPRNVYIPFHFFPGDTDYPGCRRKDKKTNPYNCTPGSRRATMLVERALATRNLYRIGIALHTFADSWAHQNFSGLNEEWNTLSSDGLNAETLIPKVGHAEVISQPDIITGKWIDARLEGEYRYIDNEQRFLEAARGCYTHLCALSGKSPDNWEWLRRRLKQLIGPFDERNEHMKERILNYIVDEYLLEYNKYEWIREAVDYNENESVLEDSFKNYDKFSWLKDQLLYKTRVFEKPALRPKPGFTDSRWYKWQEAAKAHLKEARAVLADLP
jgi:hypothetical protein